MRAFKLSIKRYRKH